MHVVEHILLLVQGQTVIHPPANILFDQAVPDHRPAIPQNTERRPLVFPRSLNQLDPSRLFVIVKVIVLWFLAHTRRAQH